MSSADLFLLLPVALKIQNSVFFPRASATGRSWIATGAIAIGIATPLVPTDGTTVASPADGTTAASVAGTTAASDGMTATGPGVLAAARAGVLVEVLEEMIDGRTGTTGTTGMTGMTGDRRMIERKIEKRMTGNHLKKPLRKRDRLEEVASQAPRFTRR